MNLFKYLETSHGLAEEGNPEQAAVLSVWLLGGTISLIIN